LIGRGKAAETGDRSAAKGRLYALYDVLLAMFCNEWTWVSLKKVQIKRVEKYRKRLRPCGRWKKERRRLAPLPNSVNSYSAAINLLVLARGFRLINHNPPPSTLNSVLLIVMPSQRPFIFTPFSHYIQRLTPFLSRFVSSATNSRVR